MPPKIAFVTCQSQPTLTDDDRLAARVLQKTLGSDAVEALPWDRPGISWQEFDAVILRSTWNYHRNVPAFNAWLGELEGLGVTTWNSPSTIRWNLDKSRYLPDLEAKGIDIVPTIFLAERPDSPDRSIGKPDEIPDLRAILVENGWNRAVVKPSISASSFQTWTCDSDRADEHSGRLTELLKHSAAMIQPFLPEIPEQGEWSLIFFGGEYSHAVLKTAAPGEFRIQEEFGGTSTPTQPSKTLHSTARKIVEAVDPIPLYARVDGVEIDERFLLAELELIEPDVFLRYDERAAERFARAILGALG